MIIIVLALGLVGGGLTVVGRSPKAFVLARYYDVKNTLVPVQGVTAEIIPPEASAPDSVPEALADGSAKAWQMTVDRCHSGQPLQRDAHDGGDPAVVPPDPDPRDRPAGGVAGQQPESPAAVPAPEDLDRVRRSVRGP